VRYATRRCLRVQDGDQVGEGATVEREAVHWRCGHMRRSSGGAHNEVFCNVVRVSKAIGLGLSGVIMVVLGRMAATGRLPRNIFAGIRIPSTLRSDEAWYAGHQAAASALTVAGCGPVVVAVAIAARSPSDEARTLLSRIANGWLLGWLGLATIQASRAARAAAVVS